jgi:hypothetical protein
MRALHMEILMPRFAVGRQRKIKLEVGSKPV